MMLVKDYMHKNITSVSKNSALSRVIRIMKLHRLSAVPVVNSKGEYSGCVTAQDILNASVPEYMKMIGNTSFMANLDQVTSHLAGMLNENASTFIDKNCACLKPDDTMSYAADLLSRDKRTILPVVENKKHLGWITKIDIISIPLNDVEDSADIG